MIDIEDFSSFVGDRITDIHSSSSNECLFITDRTSSIDDLSLEDDLREKKRDKSMDFEHMEKNEDQIDLYKEEFDALLSSPRFLFFMSNVDFHHRIALPRHPLTRSYSFLINSFSPFVSNVFHRSIQQIRSICNQHDELSSINTDVEPVASISRSLEVSTQLTRSTSMPDTRKS